MCDSVALSRRRSAAHGATAASSAPGLPCAAALLSGLRHREAKQGCAGGLPQSPAPLQPARRAALRAVGAHSAPAAFLLHLLLCARLPNVSAQPWDASRGFLGVSEHPLLVH